MIHVTFKLQILDTQIKLNIAPLMKNIKTWLFGFKV